MTLAPIAGAGAVFGSWGGACSGAGVCIVTMNADASASATFNDRRSPPPETRPAPDTGKPDRGTSGPPFQLVLPFTCFPANDLWIDRVYRDTLKRPVDQAALDFYDARLKGGASRADVALSVLQSVEYRTRLVQGFFQTFLKRAPSGPELAFWLGLLASATRRDGRGADPRLGRVPRRTAAAAPTTGSSTRSSRIFSVGRRRPPS